MAESDGAAVDVEPLRIGADLAEPGERDRGKGFVDLVKINVADTHAGPFQRPTGRRDGLLQHDYRVAGGDREIVDAGERRQAVRFQRPFAHHQHTACAVADLAGIAGGDRSALLQRLERTQRLHRRVEADAFVGAMEPLLAILADDGNGHDLPVRSEEHTSELQSLMRISYAVFCLKKKIINKSTSFFRITNT